MKKTFQLAAFGASLFSVLSGSMIILCLILSGDDLYQIYWFYFLMVTFWILAAVCGLVYLVSLAFDYFRKKKENPNWDTTCQ
jgi:tellurite resistance protein TehA-like permease